MFTKDNPDKGTETYFCVIIIKLLLLRFTKDNPDKGTETASHQLHIGVPHKFTKDNPDKGTETISGAMTM